MRFDAIGLFWEDRPKEKAPAKEKVVRIPPKPIWLDAAYLPHFAEARDWQPNLMSDDELLVAIENGDEFYYDIESYPNYLLVGFEHRPTGKLLIFETDDEHYHIDKDKLKWFYRNANLIGFNSFNYDRWIAMLAAQGTRAGAAWAATDLIIKWKERGGNVLRKFRAARVNCKSEIDLFELTPLHPSLKKMAGRMHSPLMMGLPFEPGTILTQDQITVLRWYWWNDIKNTRMLHEAHLENIVLREKMGKKYGGIDLRSDSDAQMAEAIFRAEFTKRTGRKGHKAIDRAGNSFQYEMPEWVQFSTPNLQYVKEIIENATFEINHLGYVNLPPEIEELAIPIGNMTFQMGIGGLHSQEAEISHSSEGGRFILRDHDVASYYPKLMLMFGMEPPSLMGFFASIYTGILDERLHWKQVDPKGAFDLGLKIVANGSFGKTMDPWSILYYPEMGIQTTISGQLALLMAIERLYLAHMEVINANTDGIVVKCPVEREAEMKAIFDQWSAETTLEMETTDYVSYHSQSVNSYLAFMPNGKVKTKGTFALNDLKHEPSNEICTEAIIEFIKNGTPVETTIRACSDLRKFVTTRLAAGGGVKVKGEHIEYLGKVVRWYYGAGEEGEIVTAKKGHLVGGSSGGKPCMMLPNEFPDDIDYEKYTEITNDLLDKIGYTNMMEAG